MFISVNLYIIAVMMYEDSNLFMVLKLYLSIFISYVIVYYYYVHVGCKVNDLLSGYINQRFSLWLYQHFVFLSKMLYLHCIS